MFTSKMPFRPAILITTVVGVSIIMGYIYQTEKETLSIKESYEQKFVDGSHPYPAECPLHREKLLRDTVHIAYGLQAWGPNDNEKFPYSNKWIGGGCLPEPYRYVVVMYCQKCREAETEWQAVNIRQ